MWEIEKFMRALVALFLCALIAFVAGNYLHAHFWSKPPALKNTADTGRGIHRHGDHGDNL